MVPSTCLGHQKPVSYLLVRKRISQGRNGLPWPTRSVPTHSALAPIFWQGSITDSWSIQSLAECGYSSRSQHSNHFSRFLSGIAQGQSACFTCIIAHDSDFLLFVCGLYLANNVRGPLPVLLPQGMSRCSLNCPIDRLMLPAESFCLLRSGISAGYWEYSP